MYSSWSVYYGKFGGWVKHPTEGFQNGTMVRTGDTKNVCSFDVTFTPLSGVFGGACEKYIPLSAMEGLEVCLQLDNIANVLKYEFTPYPNAYAGGLAQAMNITALRSNSKAAIDFRYSDSQKAWVGSHYPKSHVYRQSSSNSDAAAKKI